MELARSQLERDKFDTLNSLLVDAQLAQWKAKQGVEDDDIAALIEASQAGMGLVGDDDQSGDDFMDWGMKGEL